MDRIPVNSSFIESVGWENGILEIKMSNGIFRYSNVSVELFRSMISAVSVGQFYNEYIKDKFAPDF